jgi:hypothetical protein
VKIDGAEQREHGNAAEQGSTLPRSSPTAKSGAIMSR